MLYFFIIPLFLIVVFLLTVATVLTRFVEPFKPAFPFVWRSFLWSSVGFIVSNSLVLAAFLLPALLDKNQGQMSGPAKFGFVAFLFIGPVIASAVGFIGGLALGIWFAIRFKHRSRPNLSFNPDPTVRGC